MKNIMLWARRYVTIYGIIMLCTFFMCLLFNPTSELPVVSYFGRIMVFTLLSLLSMVVYYSRDELTPKGWWLRTALHALLLEAMLLPLAHRWGFCLHSTGQGALAPGGLWHQRQDRRTDQRENTGKPTGEEKGYDPMKDFIIRLENKEDYRATENLIREAFWNVYRPGCSEHYVMHVLRDDPAFIPELDFVMEQDGKLIGQNMFMKTMINADDGRDIPVLTMGPIGITPELKRQGYGKKLLDFCLEKAAAMGFGAVLFEGNIKFYSHCGFDYARKFGIRYHDLPEGADDSFFLCRELASGAGSWRRGIWTASPACIRRPRATMWTIRTWKPSMWHSRRRRS